VVVLVFIAFVIVVLPIAASETQSASGAIKEELATEIEGWIDEIAQAVGVQWEQHYISRVGKLLDSGQSADARRLYHDKSGVTWDEVDQAIANWPTTVIRYKLKILRQELCSNKGSTDAPTA